MPTPRTVAALQTPEPDAPHAEYEEFLLSQLTQIKSLATRIARSQRLSSAQDFVADVLVHLMENDYAVLRKFRRQCLLSTFLTVVITRLGLDSRVAEWGKWRPSARSRRAGAIVVLVERLTMRDGLTFDEACAVLRTNHQLILDDQALEQHYAGFNARSRPHFVSQECIVDEPVSGASADRALLDRDADQALSQATAALATTFQSLPAQDRAVLTLRFRDGLTVAAIARTLGLDQKRLHRRFAGALVRLRRSLEQAHLHKDDILGAIGRAGATPAGLFSSFAVDQAGTGEPEVQRSQTARRVARGSSAGASATLGLAT